MINLKKTVWLYYSHPHKDSLFNIIVFRWIWTKVITLSDVFKIANLTFVECLLYAWKKDQLHRDRFQWFLVCWGKEKVTTTKIRTSKTKKNIEKSSKHPITTTKIITSKRMKRTSKVSFLSDFRILTTYGISTYSILALTNKSLKTF